VCGVATTRPLPVLENEIGVDRLGRFAGARPLTVGEIQLDNNDLNPAA
jgi:hypothetical protein